MHILVSNDDGYQALGIRTLTNTLRDCGHRVTVVAPSSQRSGQSHAITMSQNISVKKISQDTYALDGTPADCVIFALQELLKQDPPDFLISGINHGLNVGVDVNYSGTVGAATEGCFMGIRSIAVSLDSDEISNDSELEPAFRRAAYVVQDILNNHSLVSNWPEQEVLNINVPVRPLAFKVASCLGSSNFQPYLIRINGNSNSTESVYSIRGRPHKEQSNLSEDAACIKENCVALSFIQCKQSSTVNNSRLEQLTPVLKLRDSIPNESKSNS